MATLEGFTEEQINTAVQNLEFDLININQIQIGFIEFFNWTAVKAPDRQFRVLAEEWNRFNIETNKMRVALNRSSFAFDTYSVNESFTASIFNITRNVLRQFDIAKPIPDLVVANADILAEYFTQIRDYLNEVIRDYIGNGTLRAEQINVGVQNLTFTLTEV